MNIVDWMLGISARGSRIGLIKFSSTDLTDVEFSFGRYNTARRIIREIRRPSFDNGKALKCTCVSANMPNSFKVGR